MDLGRITRVLIRSPNWLGDAVMFAPALAAIRHAYPQWHLTLLAKPASASLFERSPDIDDVVVYRDPGIHSGWRGLLKLGHDLKTGEYDLALLFQNSIGAAVAARLAGIPIRLGYDTDGRGWLLTHPVARPGNAKHLSLIGYFRGLLPSLGITSEETAPVLHTSDDEDSRAAALLRNHGVGSTDLLIGLNPGSVYGTAKQWSFRRYAAVANRFVEAVGAKIIIFGGPGEKELGSRVAQAMRTGPIVLSGKTTVRELMALLKRCHMLLTNDTGPMHVAAAFGVPVVAIFGPTDPAATAPAGMNHVVVTAQVGCSPCLLRACPIDHACMNGIEEQEVFGAAMALLKRSRSTTDIAVFLDRDGTINYDPGYLSDPGALKLFPGAASAIAHLNAEGIKTVVVSNQSGIGRGLFTESALAEVHGRLRDLLRAEVGATLDGIYYCPHHPDVGCQCRKPRQEMLIRASKDLHLNIGRSYMIGDKASDISLAVNARLKGIFVKTGHDPDGELTRLREEGVQPHHVTENLRMAVEWILTDIRSNAQPP